MPVTAPAIAPRAMSLNPAALMAERAKSDFAGAAAEDAVPAAEAEILKRRACAWVMVGMFAVLI